MDVECGIRDKLAYTLGLARRPQAARNECFLTARGEEKPETQKEGFRRLCCRPIPTLAPAVNCTQSGGGEGLQPRSQDVWTHSPEPLKC